MLPATTSPEGRCRQPHGMLCLTHRAVFSGALTPCESCAAHLATLRAAMAARQAPPTSSHATPCNCRKCMRIRATEP